MASPALSGNVPANMDMDDLNRWFDERFKERMAQEAATKTPSLAMISSRGSLDWAYPPFILASTAAALDWDVKIFFTFYGLNLLKKDLNLHVTPVGNPAMPMKMPFGPKWFQNINWKIPSLIKTGVPGFEALSTTLMKQTVKNKGVASIETLRESCVEAGVEFYACQMTVDLFSFNQDDFITDVKDWVGAASFLPMAQQSDVTLFV